MCSGTISLIYWKKGSFNRNYFDNEFISHQNESPYLTFTVKSKHILLVIIVSQFASTSLWFAGNTILPELISEFGFDANSLVSITSSVQAGFILGTLVFAIAAITDRFSPSKIFFSCSMLGAIFNASIYFLPKELVFVITSRFLTGLMLAGIYPVGMKIAADWYRNDLGKAIGYLVGALVLGTAFPSLIRYLGNDLDWFLILITVSILASIGGLLVLLFIADGPYRQPMVKFNRKAITLLFKPGGFRSASFGYFGHMWELYSFWAFIPIILNTYNQIHGSTLDLYLWAFLIISIGALGCSFGGIMVKKFGSASIAFYNLTLSGLCILLFPLLIYSSLIIFLLYLLLWGWTVVGDSPQFSALAASKAPKDMIGSGLTIMNSIGFFLSIISIYALNSLVSILDIRYAILILLPGPIFGIYAIFPLRQKALKNTNLKSY